MDEVITYKKDWVLTKEAFDKFLDWLDADRERAGERYELLRDKLVSFFERKKCLVSDDLADETIKRVARRITEDENILKEAPLNYCYRMAKLVFLEHWRDPTRTQPSVDDPSITQQPVAEDTQAVADREAERYSKELRLECLKECLSELPPETRELILQFYQGEGRAKIANRRVLAERFERSTNAQSTYLHRLRRKLEACVTERVRRYAN